MDDDILLRDVTFPASNCIISVGGGISDIFERQVCFHDKKKEGTTHL